MAVGVWRLLCSWAILVGGPSNEWVATTTQPKVQDQVAASVIVEWAFLSIIVDLKGRGVPIGYRSQTAMEALLRPFEKLQHIIMTGLATGDPNIMVLEAEIDTTLAQEQCRTKT